LFRQAAKQLEDQVAADPACFRTRRDLAAAFQRLGVLSSDLGELVAARGYYRQAQAGFKALVALDPLNVMAQADVAANCNNFGRLAVRENDFPQAISWFERATAILEPLEAAGKLRGQPAYQGWLQHIRQQLAFCRAAGRAIDDLDFALAQPPELVAELLIARAVALARRGQLGPAAATAEALRRRAPDDADNLYNVACCYALCAAGVTPSQAGGGLTAAEQATRKGYAARAVADLEAAVARGYKDVGNLRSDPDLASIRQEEGYRKLLDRLQATAGPAKPKP
jgi:tetratricopeptide (TPR) repeat protein